MRNIIAIKVKKSNSIDLSNYFHEIKSKAYDIFFERQQKNTPGDEVSDWLKAEVEIKKKYKIK